MKQEAGSRKAYKKEEESCRSKLDEEQLLQLLDLRYCLLQKLQKRVKIMHEEPYMAAWQDDRFSRHNIA